MIVLEEVAARAVGDAALAEDAECGLLRPKVHVDAKEIAILSSNELCRGMSVGGEVGKESKGKLEKERTDAGCACWGWRGAPAGDGDAHRPILYELHFVTADSEVHSPRSLRDEQRHAGGASLTIVFA